MGAPALVSTTGVGTGVSLPLVCPLMGALALVSTTGVGTGVSLPLVCLYHWCVSTTGVGTGTPTSEDGAYFLPHACQYKLTALHLQDANLLDALPPLILHIVFDGLAMRVTRTYVIHASVFFCQVGLQKGPPAAALPFQLGYLVPL